MSLKHDLAMLDRALARVPRRNPDNDSAPDAATLYRDRLTGRAWLHFAQRPSPDAIAALKADGWRWSGYREAWHNPRRFIRPPPIVGPWGEGGEVDYSTERAERLSERSGRKLAEARGHEQRATSIAELIPMGQPILVGHHSERRHRRDLARIGAGYQKAHEGYEYARALEGAAVRSEAYQEHIQSAPTIQRRLDRLRADLRALERREQDWGRDAWLQRVADVRGEVERTERALVEAGGPVVVADVAPDDLILIKGHKVRVARVGPKSISGEIVEGGAAGMTGKWDKSHFQRVLEKGTPAAAPARKPRPTARDRLEKAAWSATPMAYRGRWSERTVMLPPSMGGGLARLATLTEDQLRALAR